MDASPRRFGTTARRQQARFRATLGRHAQEPSDEKGVRNHHLLALGHEIENLCPGLRGRDGALAFFKERAIKWWTSARSGDRALSDDYEGPTRNLASSQVSCVNFLLPLAGVPGALLAFLRCLDDDVLDVEFIVDRNGNSSQVEFEWVGWNEPLEGGSITRGAYQTSVDAILVARAGSGRRVYLLEWKYCEEYLHPKDKGAGSSGETRRSRYQSLFERPASAFHHDASLHEFMFEPFYQIMRLVLLADRMLPEGVTPQLPVEEAHVVVVCPTENLDYRLVVRDTPLGRRFPGLPTVEEAVQATLKAPRSFSVVGQEQIVAALRAGDMASQLDEWLEYHRLRYGW